MPGGYFARFSFALRFQSSKIDNTPFLNTFGIYIDRIADMDYREELLKVLIPMQKKLDGTPDFEEDIPETNGMEMK